MLPIKTDEIKLTMFPTFLQYLPKILDLEHECGDRDNANEASVGDVVALSTRVEDRQARWRHIRAACCALALGYDRVDRGGDRSDVRDRGDIWDRGYVWNGFNASVASSDRSGDIRGA